MQLDTNRNAHCLDLIRQLTNKSVPHKEWSLIDCVSFVVMTERGLSEALTADEHLRQMRFRPLLKEPHG